MIEKDEFEQHHIHFLYGCCCAGENLGLAQDSSMEVLL
jgi:hypothetical protein